LQNVRMSSSNEWSGQSQPSSVNGCRVLAKIFSRSFYDKNVASFRRRFVVCGEAPRSTGSVLNRSKTGRKSLTFGGSATDRQTRQSCLPPKKRHRLEMTPGTPQGSDVSKVLGVGRGRSARKTKHRLGQKPRVKSSKFCSKFC